MPVLENLTSLSENKSKDTPCEDHPPCEDLQTAALPSNAGNGNWKRMEEKELSTARKSNNSYSSIKYNNNNTGQHEYGTMSTVNSQGAADNFAETLVPFGIGLKFPRTTYSKRSFPSVEVWKNELETRESTTSKKMKRLCLSDTNEMDRMGTTFLGSSDLKPCSRAIAKHGMTKDLSQNEVRDLVDATDKPTNKRPVFPDEDKAEDYHGSFESFSQNVLHNSRAVEQDGTFDCLPQNARIEGYVTQKDVSRKEVPAFATRDDMEKKGTSNYQEIGLKAQSVTQYAGDSKVPLPDEMNGEGDMERADTNVPETKTCDFPGSDNDGERSELPAKSHDYSTTGLLLGDKKEMKSFGRDGTRPGDIASPLKTTEAEVEESRTLLDEPVDQLGGYDLTCQVKK